MKILILEDESLAQDRLVSLVLELEPSATLLACLDSVENALKWFENNEEPDLILSDIHLADGSSFLLYEKFKPKCPIIFITAYDEYALRAFKLNSIDYLLKPINKEELKFSINKYKTSSIGLNISFDKAINTLLSNQRIYKDRFLVKLGDRLQTINTLDVSYFVSEDKYVMLVHHDRKYPIDFNLEELDQLLDPKVFFRINRKLISHISSITKITAHFNGKYKIDLNPSYGEDVFVSRERASDFKNWLDGNV